MNLLPESLISKAAALRVASDNFRHGLPIDSDKAWVSLTATECLAVSQYYDEKGLTDMSTLWAKKTRVAYLQLKLTKAAGKRLKNKGEQVVLLMLKDMLDFEIEKLTDFRKSFIPVADCVELKAEIC
jgi:hypothetical protein